VDTVILKSNEPLRSSAPYSKRRDFVPMLPRVRRRHADFRLLTQYFGNGCAKQSGPSLQAVVTSRPTPANVATPGEAERAHVVVTRRDNGGGYRGRRGLSRIQRPGVCGRASRTGPGHSNRPPIKPVADCGSGSQTEDEHHPNVLIKAMIDR